MENRKVYIILALGVFILLLVILIFLEDQPFFRYSLGDVLVVIFLYLLLKAARPDMAPVKAGVAVGLVALGIEIMQYYKIPQWIGGDNYLVKVVLGSTFQWTDLVAYTVGLFLIVLTDKNSIMNKGNF